MSRIPLYTDSRRVKEAMKFNFRAILAGVGLVLGSAGVGAWADPGLKVVVQVSAEEESVAWPKPGSQARQAAQAAAASRFAEVLQAMDARSEPGAVSRTRYFLVAGDLSQEERTRLGTILDGQVHRLVERFGGSINDEPFPSRLGIILMGSRDRFELLEAQQFESFAPGPLAARLHLEGSTLLIAANAAAPRGHFDHQLSRAMAQAWLYGIDTDRSLPTWAEQGFMTAVAWMSTPPGTGPGRREAIDSVRAGRELHELLAHEQDWTGGAIDDARAGLLMERLLEQPETLLVWIKAVKAGRDWRIAFTEAFDSTPEELAEYTARWYRVND